MTASLTLDSLPLFPLHTVLFPQGYLPLRVFETRYRTMVQRCREQGTPFGVVTLLTGDEQRHDDPVDNSFHHIGTTAAIDSSAALSTGLDLLKCTGAQRFRILTSRKLEDELWVANVQVIPCDQSVPVPQDLAHSAKALQHVISKLPAHRDKIADASRFSDCGWVANRWCELLPMSQKVQLQLLELNSPLLRLELVTDALEEAGILS